MYRSAADSAFDRSRNDHYHSTMGRLVMVSNRVPAAADLDPSGKGAGAVGGLVSAVRASLVQTGGLWMGWSGRTTQRRPQSTPAVSVTEGPVQLATIDLTTDESNLFYTGFSNRTLWPLLHSFTERAQIRHDTYRAYRRVNRKYAQALLSLLDEDDMVWVHDYQVISVGYELRQLGWSGRLGFFLHTPFPGADVFSILPWCGELLSNLVSYDLVGLHTRSYMSNLAGAFLGELGGDWNGRSFRFRDEAVQLGVFPIGIDPTTFRNAALSSSESLPRILGLPERSKMIIGVDRLDYTKGIPHRLEAFARMLDQHRDMHGRVSFVQISNPSRTRVPEYVREREAVERLVGRINGRHADGRWVPVRYLYRRFGQDSLAAFYRDADVNMVTPLRDGMNLIAKEFVASQTRDPGVLVLSRFAGAAEELSDAIIVNPFDIEGMARALYEALEMPIAERRMRWERMNDVVQSRTATRWSEKFTAELEQMQPNHHVRSIHDASLPT